MVQIKARIILNKVIKADYWRCIMSAASVAKDAKPGQFINIKITDGLRPFLRRPFSINNINGRNLEIIYEVVGEGSAALARKKKGDFLDLIGPLGNVFSCTLAPSSRRLSILVGGGIGIAPLLFLARKIKAKNKIVLIGSRNKGQVLCEKEFRNAGCDVKISTDDGSVGFKGRVTDLLKEILRSKIIKPSSVFIYSCGPRPMLKELSGIAIKNSLPAQISLEEHMSCGIGACLGCVVKTKNGLERVCKEGPVFNASDLIW